MLSLLLIAALATNPADAPVALPAAERQADGRLLLSKEAESAINLRIQVCQAKEKDEANKKPLPVVQAVFISLGVGVLIGGVVAGLVVGVAMSKK